jgi:hypothetical protein
MSSMALPTTWLVHQTLDTQLAYSGSNMTETAFHIKSCDDKPTLHECISLITTHATLQMLCQQTLPCAADPACNCNVHRLTCMSAAESAQMAA